MKNTHWKVCVGSVHMGVLYYLIYFNLKKGFKKPLKNKISKKYDNILKHLTRAISVTIHFIFNLM